MRVKTRRALELTQATLQYRLERLQENKTSAIRTTAKRIQAKELGVVKLGLKSLLQGNRHGVIKGSENMQRFVAAHLDEISQAEKRRKICVLNVSRSRLIQQDLWIFAAEYCSLCAAEGVGCGMLSWEVAIARKKMAIQEGGTINLIAGVPNLVCTKNLMQYAKPGDLRRRTNAIRASGQGLGLFRMVKPQKKYFTPPLMLRYIRKLRQLIRMVMHSDEWRDTVIDFEDDDHAYMAFDRQIGNRGGRSSKVIVAEGSECGVWQKDFSDPFLHVTPWACRIRQFTVVSDERSVELVRSKKDQHVVITGPRVFFQVQPRSFSTTDGTCASCAPRRGSNLGLNLMMPWIENRSPPCCVCRISADTSLRNPLTLPRSWARLLLHKRTSFELPSNDTHGLNTLAPVLIFSTT